MAGALKNVLRARKIPKNILLCVAKDQEKPKVFGANWCVDLN
jgi:hypothetical protein